MVPISITFTIIYSNIEEFRKKLMLAWGQPDVINSGNLIWKKLSLQDIGNNLEIRVTDGILTEENGNPSFKVFSDYNSKYEELKNLQLNQSRHLEIGFFSQGGFNIITTKNLENSVIKVLNFISDFVW